MGHSWLYLIIKQFLNWLAISNVSWMGKETFHIANSWQSAILYNMLMGKMPLNYHFHLNFRDLRNKWHLIILFLCYIFYSTIKFPPCKNAKQKNGIWTFFEITMPGLIKYANQNPNATMADEYIKNTAYDWIYLEFYYLNKPSCIAHIKYIIINKWLKFV